MSPRAGQDRCGKSRPFSNVLTVIFVTGCYSKVYFFCNCIKQLITYLSKCNFIQVMKSRWMREFGHVACMEERRYGYRAWEVKPERERDIAGRITAKWVVKK